MKVNRIHEWKSDIRSSVHNIASNVKSSNFFNQYHADTNLVYFFEQGKENPSLAKIITNNEISKRHYFTRKKFFNKYFSDEFDWQRQKFEDVFTELYPKTHSLRDKLINAGRISLDKVKPKASKLEKFLIMKKP